jgi:predicted ATPase
MMRMRQFRVQNFKCIEDTGWIRADDVTVLVGKNESGKTTILKALHKFNSATSIPFDPLREFPRARFTKDFEKQDWPVVSIVFDLPGSIRDQLADLDETFAAEEVVCTRYYSGDLAIEFRPQIDLESVTGPQILDWLDKALEHVRQTTVNGRGEELTQLKTTLLDYLENQKADVIKGLPTQENVLQLLHRYRNELATRTTEEWHKDVLSKLQQDLQSLIERQESYDRIEEAEELIEANLPIFIYFENYGILDSKVHLPTYLQELGRSPHDSRMRTTQTMFLHVGLDPQQLLQLGQEPAQGEAQQVEVMRRKKDERAIRAESASFDLTGRFSEWWSQRRHRVEFDLDGSYLRMWVSDNKNPARIELEERSKGFQWFFSFYLVFQVESEEGHKDAILLLDEPGLHLHPTAQQELIGFLNKISADNQLVYSTHSPFMIDGDHLERARACFEQADGTTKVSEDIWPRDRESVFPLQAALGYSMAQTLFQGQKSLVVEGITEYWALKALSEILTNGGREGLAAEVIITPAGGAKKVTYLASLMASQDVEVVVLLDSDEIGDRTKRELLKDLFIDAENRILLIGDILGFSEADLEELFPRSYYLDAVAQAYGKRIGMNVLSKEEKEEPRVAKAMQHLFDRKGWGVFEKWRPVRHLLDEWRDCKLEDLPEELVDKAEQLFKEINKRLS